MAPRCCGLAGVAAFPLRASGYLGQTEDGWVTLFDGKNLDNFNQVGTANWHIEDGAVEADKGNGYLVSNTYTDYQIRAEFWIDDVANSGIFIRCTDPEKIGSGRPMR